jgi:hypothetical protein
MLKFLKNMLQLFLAPAKGWEEVEHLNESPLKLMDKGLNPLLAILAITAFCHGFYGSQPFEIGTQLLTALSQFIAYFLGVMFGRAMFESLMPYFTGQPVNALRAHTVVVYAIGLMTVNRIIQNLCPIDLAVLWFLPAFVAMVIWQSRIYLSVKSERSGQFFIFAVAVLIAAPIIFYQLLDLLV